MLNQQTKEGQELHFRELVEMTVQQLVSGQKSSTFLKQQNLKHSCLKLSTEIMTMIKCFTAKISEEHRKLTAMTFVNNILQVHCGIFFLLFRHV